MLARNESEDNGGNGGVEERRFAKRVSALVGEEARESPIQRRPTTTTTTATATTTARAAAAAAAAQEERKGSEQRVARAIRTSCRPSVLGRACRRRQENRQRRGSLPSVETLERRRRKRLFEEQSLLRSRSVQDRGRETGWQQESHHVPRQVEEKPAETDETRLRFCLRRGRGSYHGGSSHRR